MTVIRSLVGLIPSIGDTDNTYGLIWILFEHELSVNSTFDTFLLVKNLDVMNAINDILCL